MPRFLRSLNILATCRAYRVKLWQCPPFLFVLFGFITIFVMLATYSIAQQYFEEIQVVALVSGVTVVLFIIGYAIVIGFERLATASLLKSEFVSVVSHQLRTPLSSMRWLIEFMTSGRSGTLPDEQKEHLVMLNDITLRMLRLVNLLLDVNQVEERRLTVEKDHVDIRALTQANIQNFMPLARSRNVTITLEADPSLPPVSTDTKRLNVVIQNLIENAIQYSLGGGKVTIQITQQRGNIRWSIHDQGVGIPKSERSKIFEKFFRAHNAARFQTRGSGLGLFISKSFVEAMGGEMNFSSEEQKGSTFWFTLPINT